MITYVHFLLLDFEFKSYFTYKYFIKDSINKVIHQFCFKWRPNNTPMNSILGIVNLNRPT